MSENILTEIYNKILGLFGQATVKDESKNTAVNRLRLVLMQDRTNLTPEIMNRMRSELIEVLSKYVELDKEALDLNIGQEGEQMALMLSIPVIRAKDEAEIQETLKKEDEAKRALEEKEETQEAEEAEEKTEESDTKETNKTEEDNSKETEETTEEKSEEVETNEETKEDTEIEEESKSEEETEISQEEKPKKKKEETKTEE